MPRVSPAEIIQAQIDSQKKSLKKAEKRKTRADKKKRERPSPKGEPNTKKKKLNSRVIPFLSHPDALTVLRTVFCCLPAVNSALGKKGFFLSLEDATVYHKFYPILLSEGTTKKKPADYLIGAAKAPVIFTGLREAFDILYGSSPEYSGRYEDWEVYRWNKRYYGAKIEKQSKSLAVHAMEIAQTRAFGGSSILGGVHWAEEDKNTNKISRAISVAEVYEKTGGKIDFSPVPDIFDVYPRNYLRDLTEKVTQTEQSINDAVTESEKALQSSEIRTIIESLDEDDEPSETDDETESEEESEEN